MSRKELPRAGLVTAAVSGRISNREGAAALHMTPRQFQRLKQRFRETGAVGLRHQTRGRPSQRRLPASVAAQVQALLRDRYAGFNDTHFTEKLREEHGLVISRESVRRLRRALGLPARHRRRPAQHRSRRLREAAAGQLLQLDGSPFDWLEARGPRLTLLGAIDDATSQVVALHFRPTEDLHGYATLLHHVFATVGLPVALYGDGVSILVRNDRHWTLDEELAGTQSPTHLGQVLQELGIGYVQARSPQAKGRVEIRELLDGRVVVLLDAIVIATAPSPGPDFTLIPRSRPGSERRDRRSSTPRPRVTTALAHLAAAVPRSTRRHPWHYGYDLHRALKAGYVLHDRG